MKILFKTIVSQVVSEEILVGKRENYICANFWALWRKDFLTFEPIEEKESSRKAVLSFQRWYVVKIFLREFFFHEWWAILRRNALMSLEEKLRYFRLFRPSFFRITWKEASLGRHIALSPKLRLTLNNDYTSFSLPL